MAGTVSDARGVAEVMDLTNDTPPKKRQACGPPCSGPEDPMRSRIMAAAGQVNAQASNNALLAQLHAERRARQSLQASASGPSAPPPGQAAPSSPPQAASKPQHVARDSASSDRPAGSSAPSNPSKGQTMFSLLTWNVWFQEEVALGVRMTAIGDTVEELGLPDFICLQEVTLNIYHMLSRAAWWQHYLVSPMMPTTYFTVLLSKAASVQVTSPASFLSFPDSAMARGLQHVSVHVGGRELIVATSHLESPIPGQSLYSEERQSQCGQGVAWLQQKAQQGCSIVWAGDLNWTEAKDGPLPLGAGWHDAWASLHPSKGGFTYDGKANGMLANGFRSRLDRVLTCLQGWQTRSIKMVGTHGIAGQSYVKTYPKRPARKLGVWPSDHFGIFAEFDRQQPP